MKKITATALTVMSAMSISTAAVAADTGWGGVYGGLSVGYQDALVQNDTYTLNYFGLNGTPHPRSVIGGGFVGYNMDLPGDHFLLGGEASLDVGGQRDSIPANGFGWGAHATVPGVVKLKGRVGYTGHAGFMPWLDLGVAAGRTEYSLTGTSGDHGVKTALGTTAGLGVDYAWRGPLFARVSYEYTYLGKETFFRDQPGESFDLHDFKIGLGYKF